MSSPPIAGVGCLNLHLVCQSWNAEKQLLVPGRLSRVISDAILVRVGLAGLCGDQMVGFQM